MSYDSLKRGLQNIIDYQNGDVSKCVVRSGARQTKKAVPVKEYSKEEIKALRNGNHLSQRFFAEIMGVTPQTVEAWEAGKSKPSGTASRLFQLIEHDKNVLEEMILQQ